MEITIPSNLSNDELVAEVTRLAAGERDATTHLVAYLAELDARRLYLGAGFSSLYTYCREVLHLSEDAAYNRMKAAQVVRRFPVVLHMLADGRVNLTTVRLLAPVLTADNHRCVLAEAAGKSKREVEELAVRLAPRPDVPPSIRKLGAPRSIGAVTAGMVAAARPSLTPERTNPSSGGSEAAPRTMASPAGYRFAVAPLSPARYRIQFTVGKETEERLRRLQDLLRREIPDGDPGAIFDRATILLLKEVERKKHAETSKPRRGRGTKPGSRYIPAPVRREVSRRDEGRCAFVAKDGRRCTERAYIEYHHAGTPHAHGGEATVENMALRCGTHNAYEGALIFGPYCPSRVREAGEYAGPVPEREVRTG